MATSGTVTFSETRDVLVLDSLVDAGVIGVGYVPDSNTTEFAQRTLNLMLKSWQAEGLHLWKVREFTLFLEKSNNSYSLGPTGDNWTIGTVVSTQMRVAAALLATTIEVDSTTGMTTGDYVGIEVDDGTMHWTTITNVVDGDTITITTGIDAAAAIDNRVFTYTTKAPRPNALHNVMVRNEANEDRPVNLISRNEYYNFSVKTDTGDPSNFYFHPTTTNATLKCYVAPSRCTDRLMGTAEFHIEDLTAASHDFDCPQEWLLPIRLNLGVLLMPAASAGSTEYKILRSLAQEYKDMVLGWDREQVSMYLQPQTR